MTLHAALSMGGYGAYVWTSYGITLLGLSGLAIGARHRWRSAIKKARRRLKSRESSGAMTPGHEEIAQDETVSSR